MSFGRHLVVMLRAPQVGVGKRRLAREIGDLAAWRFQRLAAERLLRKLAGDRRWTTWLALTPDSAKTRRRLWPGLGRRLPQGGGDLGQRMGRMLQAPPPGPVVLIGADSPGIEARHIAAAFRDLGRHNWVFGPAEDGGYWLIGARRRPCLRLPFAAVRWSSRHALADTLGQTNGSHSLQEYLADVDTRADLLRLANSKPQKARRSLP